LQAGASDAPPDDADWADSSSAPGRQQVSRIRIERCSPRHTQNRSHIFRTSTRAHTQLFERPHGHGPSQIAQQARDNSRVHVDDDGLSSSEAHEVKHTPLVSARLNITLLGCFEIQCANK
jgi:hypothetical protein